MKLAHWAFLCTCLAVSHMAIAEEVQIVGDIKQAINTPSSQLPRAVFNKPMQVTLLKLQLSDKAQQSLTNRLAHVTNNSEFAAAYNPPQIQLGMNNVPVLNQGAHGTCVTFATTAAIDAAIGKGDYVSQLCQLELGQYLEHNAYTSSGWEGSWGRLILNQMDVFGIVNKANQKSLGCGGLTEYPLMGETPNVELPPMEYHQLSEPLPQDLAWSSLLEVYQVAIDKTDTNKILNDVKTALNAGDRLTFGILLLDFDRGVVGAVGSHRSPNDTWVLTPEIAADINDQTEFAGHEMLITGYDDNAITIDNKGRKYRGLLTLRNSWGDGIGDKGDFYMSYDYFKTLVLEVQRIRTLKKS